MPELSRSLQPRLFPWASYARATHLGPAIPPAERP